MYRFFNFCTQSPLTRFLFQQDLEEMKAALKGMEEEEAKLREMQVSLCVHVFERERKRERLLSFRLHCSKMTRGHAY